MIYFICMIYINIVLLISLRIYKKIIVYYVSFLHLLIFLLVLNKGKWKKRKDDYDEYNDDDSIDSNEADGVPDAAKNDVEKQDECAIEDEFGAKDYRSQMILKPDCASRPLWVVRICLTLKLDKKNLFYKIIVK